MGSILQVRMCQEPFKAFFHQRSSAFFTLKTSLSKSLLLPLSARSLCTQDIDPLPSSRQKDRRNSGQTYRQAGVNTTIRHREQDLWDDVVQKRGQAPLFPKSVFASGMAKRTAELMKRKAAMNSQDEERHEVRRHKLGRHEVEPKIRLQPPDRPLSAAEWKQLKESLGNLNRFDFHMMQKLFITGAELDIAKSLLTYVAMETGTLSYEVLLRYLTLCVRGGHDTEVFDVYDIMRGSFPSLETGASSLFIKSFSRTARWREAINILHEVKRVVVPSSRQYGDVISAAVLNGDITTAWTLYDELIETGLTPEQETWDALFKGARKTKEENGKEMEAMSQSEHQERLLEILFYMRNNQIYPQLSLASTIKTWFESLPGEKWTGSWASASPKGECRSCGSELESIQLSAEEYQRLKDSVMTYIIEGQNVFIKTTPEELVRFKEFIKKMPTFDVVIDGLNAANTNVKSKKSETLLAVVTELERQGLTMLMLGRKHMLQPSRSWDKNNMRLIRQKAHCFFTNNISEDDPFLLYATLYSGVHCRFVSKDLMRDHKARLPDVATRRLFFKWQRGHQLVLNGSVTALRGVNFQSIFSYDTIVQTSANSWHLPYDSTDERSSHEVPEQWLCLTKKH